MLVDVPHCHIDLVVLVGTLTEQPFFQLSVPPYSYSADRVWRIWLPANTRALSETTVCCHFPLHNLAHLLYPDRASTRCEVGCGRRLDYHVEVGNRLLSNAADSMSILTRTTKRTTLCDLAKCKRKRPAAMWQSTLWKVPHGRTCA